MDIAAEAIASDIRCEPDEQKMEKQRMIGELNPVGASESGGLLLAGLKYASHLERVGMATLRIALVFVLAWIGGLKFAGYEADSIVPFVANSPLMRFLYRYPDEYKTHMNKEGELKPTNRVWHKGNYTYGVSHGIAFAELAIALLILLYPVEPRLSALGSALLVLMSLTTLSFLITTPEAWVPALGDTNHGFPYLSGAGRLVLKDCIMLGAAIVTLADSAKVALNLR